MTTGAATLLRGFNLSQGSTITYHIIYSYRALYSTLSLIILGLGTDSIFFEGGRDGVLGVGKSSNYK